MNHKLPKSENVPEPPKANTMNQQEFRKTVEERLRNTEVPGGKLTERERVLISIAYSLYKGNNEPDTIYQSDRITYLGERMIGNEEVQNIEIDLTCKCDEPDWRYFRYNTICNKCKLYQPRENP